MNKAVEHFKRTGCIPPGAAADVAKYLRLRREGEIE